MARMLIADVDKNFGQLLKQELEDMGFTVDVILRGDAATPRFNGMRSYDVVLLDMHMPGLDYYQRLTRIKEYAGNAQVVVFADSVAPEERSNLLDAGANACFAKHEIGRLKHHLRQCCDSLSG